MHSCDQDFFVVRAVEYSDASTSGKAISGSPEKIMFELFCTRMLETVHVTSLRIDARKHMLDRAIFASGVHGLKDQQQRITVRRIEHALQMAQLFHIVHKKFFVMFFRLVKRIDGRCPFVQLDLMSS